MMSDMNKVAIAYRIYPEVSKIPPVFANDKYKMSELCLRSFRDSLEGLDIKMWALMDNCPPEYEELFVKYFGDRDLEFVHLPGVGNGASFGKQMDILSKQNFSENIYFAEDDYFYLPGKFHLMTDLISNESVDFVSPYDHLDYYELRLHDHPSEVLFSGDRHWKTSATTCMTFLTTKKALRQTESVFRTYTRNNYDTSLWMSLTRYRALNPAFYLRSLRNSYYLKVLLKMWMHSPLETLLGRRRKLYTPLPSIATHMDNKHLAPTINWYRLFEKYDI
jgi:hypothetical protein